MRSRAGRGDVSRPARRHVEQRDGDYVDARKRGKQIIPLIAEVAAGLLAFERRAVVRLGGQVPH